MIKYFQDKGGKAYFDTKMTLKNIMVIRLMMEVMWPMKGIRILVAEDEDKLRAIVLKYLKKVKKSLAKYI